jgi:hypothetical protein
MESGVLGIDQEENLPAVARHAHSLGFGHPIELGTLLKVLLATDTLGIAETSLGHSIDITPACIRSVTNTHDSTPNGLLTAGDLEAPKCKSLVLLDSPAIQMTDT